MRKPSRETSRRQASSTATNKDRPDPRAPTSGAPIRPCVSRTTNDNQQTAVRWFEVSAHAEEQRLDNFLLSRLKGLPRSHLYRLIRKGEVRVNKKRCKPDTRLAAGDMIRVAPVRLTAEQRAVPGQSLQRLLRKSVLYQDDALLVLNKPAGVPVHAGSGTSVGIIEALRFMAGPDGYRELVHRLDKETSGCLLVACHGKALKQLQNSFRHQEVGKSYLAIVHGHWPASCREVRAPLMKSQPTDAEAVVTVDPSGKPALTRFALLGTGPRCSLILARPVTGRTHQIRVHSQYAGHPLVGDDRYTLDSFATQLSDIRQLQLHAAGLDFPHPDTGRRLAVSCPLRDEMLQVASREGLSVPTSKELASAEAATSTVDELHPI